MYKKIYFDVLKWGFFYNNNKYRENQVFMSSLYITVWVLELILNKISGKTWYKIK